MMCGIDHAIEIIKKCDFLYGVPDAELIINRLDYHHRQAVGVKPKYHKGMTCQDYYTCGNCGKTVTINDDFCSGCGFAIKWDSVRCLTGLPLVDAAERKI